MIYTKINRSRNFFFYIFSISVLFIFNLHAQKIYINEFLASNVTINPDNIDFDDYSDWIEIYNDENSNVDLSGYYLTDSLDILSKWQIPQGTYIPAKGYLYFWADGFDDKPGTIHQRDAEPFNQFATRDYHLNFKVSALGEEIGLSNPELVLIDSVVFDKQITDVSFGRKPDGSSNWFYFGEPTAGHSNITEGLTNTQLSGEVVFSQDAGFYISGLLLELSTDNESAIIYYTTDGSKPGSQSLQYTSPINITETTVIRARVFEPGKLPGN